MAVVKQWTTKEGTVIKINDEYFRGISKEENQRRLDNISRTASILLSMPKKEAR